MSVHIRSYLVFPSIQCACASQIKAAPGKGPDINLAFRPDDNHNHVVHEYFGLEPGDAHGLRAIQGFITIRTDPTRAPMERLHSIW